MRKKIILFLVTEDWYFISHKIEYAIFLIKHGYYVNVCCKNTGKFDYIKGKGINCFDIKAKRKSLSALDFFSEVISFYNCIKKVKPNTIHLVSLRPAVVGLLASLMFKNIKVYITFTGLGFIFIKKNFYVKILRFFIQLFFIIFSRIKKAIAIVQNKDDYQYFLKNYFFKTDSLFIIRGSGVDLKYFKKVDELNSSIINICYAGRMLKDKGVHWLAKGFKLAREQNSNIQLILAGSLDMENPTTIKKEFFKKILNQKGIKYLGNVKDMRKFWNRSHVAILLSKREGLPLSLMEAAAVGRPIIASDVTGCREIAINDFNAITVNPSNIKEVKEAILRFASNKNLRLQYGKNSRKIVKKDMEKQKVFKKYLELYDSK